MKGDYILDAGLGQQTCKVCGRPDKFNFQVPDETWASVVPPKFHNSVVCLYCFDEFAGQKDIAYHPHLSKLYFAGRQATFTFNTKSRVGRC